MNRKRLSFFTPVVPITTLKYGITEQKKADLDATRNKILDVQYEVDQYQAIVNSLTDKQLKFQGMLATADQDRTRTLANQNLVDQAAKITFDLVNNSEVAKNEIAAAEDVSNTSTPKEGVASYMEKVVAKLIYSAEVINKLAATVIKAKALNPLISDSLVSKLTTAGTDANNAVALSLVALSSTLAAEAVNIESKAALDLQNSQAKALWKQLTGSKKPLSEESKTNSATLYGRLHIAYTKAQSQYNTLHRALSIVNNQLSAATSRLSAAQVNLSSLQSAYAAGNSAALAS